MYKTLHSFCYRGSDIPCSTRYSVQCCTLSVTEVLTYHVVPATVYSAALFLEGGDEVKVKTVEGGSIMIKKEGGL